jgi:hypothetical protein
MWARDLLGDRRGWPVLGCHVLRFRRQVIVPIERRCRWPPLSRIVEPYCLASEVGPCEHGGAGERHLSELGEAGERRPLERGVAGERRLVELGEAGERRPEERGPQRMLESYTLVGLSKGAATECWPAPCLTGIGQTAIPADAGR